MQHFLPFYAKWSVLYVFLPTSCDLSLLCKTHPGDQCVSVPIGDSLLAMWQISLGECAMIYLFIYSLWMDSLVVSSLFGLQTVHCWPTLACISLIFAYACFRCVVRGGYLKDVDLEVRLLNHKLSTLLMLIGALPCILCGCPFCQRFPDILNVWDFCWVSSRTWGQCDISLSVLMRLSVFSGECRQLVVPLWSVWSWRLSFSSWAGARVLRDFPEVCLYHRGCSCGFLDGSWKLHGQL